MCTFHPERERAKVKRCVYVCSTCTTQTIPRLGKSYRMGRHTMHCQTNTCTNCERTCSCVSSSLISPSSSVLAASSPELFCDRASMHIPSCWCIHDTAPYTYVCRRHNRVEIFYRTLHCNISRVWYVLTYTVCSNAHVEKLWWKYFSHCIKFDWHLGCMS